MNERIPVMEHISVCICTYKRPAMLKNLLEKLSDLKTSGRFTYSVVVVDNDELASARSIVAEYMSTSKIPMRYDVEQRRGFAHVRNRAIEKADGDYIAFIDDDEYPHSDWLYNLYDTIKTWKADGILGPVLPHYDTEPPKWILQGRLCERETFKTGTVIKSHVFTRTGNVLLVASLFHDDLSPFDPRYGKTGGEDTDFFRRMMNKGKSFVWCDEAPVWEWVPKERMERAYFLKRALQRGAANSRRASVVSIDTCRSLAAILLYTAALPFCLVMGQHVLMKTLIRDCDHIGKVLGMLGIILVKQRSC